MEFPFRIEPAPLFPGLIQKILDQRQQVILGKEDLFRLCLTVPSLPRTIG
jgi:hypothetical protein